MTKKMSKKYLVVLKNPGASFMVDGIVGKFPRRIKSMDFMQEGKMLYISVHADSNIAYIQEMTDEEIEEVEIRIVEMKDKLAEMRAKLVKPKFKFPVGKPS